MKPNTEQNPDLIRYQAQKLQDLMSELMDCCGRKTTSQARNLDLAPAEVECLRLFGGERYLTAKNIAAKLEVAKSRVTKIIGGLVEKGLVQRLDDPRDARVRLLCLTPEGAERRRRIEDLLEENHRRLLLQLNPDERTRVLSALGVLRAAMEVIK